jgi:hypothetical protein
MINEMSEIFANLQLENNKEHEASCMLTSSNCNCFYFVPFFPTGTQVHQNKINQHSKKIQRKGKSDFQIYNHTRCKNKVKVQHAANGVIFLRCCPGHAHAEVCGLRVI